MLSGVIIPWRERPERRAELHPFCLRGWHIASLAQENQMLSIDVGRLQTNWTQIQSAGTHKDSNLSFDLQPWGDDPDPRLELRDSPNPAAKWLILPLFSAGGKFHRPGAGG
jgi:hypothetical protein